MNEKSFVIAVLTCILVSLLFVTTAESAPSRGALVLERRRDRILRLQEEEKKNSEQTADQLRKMADNIIQRSIEFQATVAILIEQMDSQMCSIGLQKFCPPEPEPTDFSTGHTVKVIIDVRVSAYNNLSSQTDSTPCEGWAGNICEAHKKGLNPIAASQDIAVYPLGRNSKVKLTSKTSRPECKALEGKTYTIMDTMSSCLTKNRDLRTGRCLRPVTNRLDLFIPCEDKSCIRAYKEAINFGGCNMTVEKL